MINRGQSQCQLDVTTLSVSPKEIRATRHSANNRINKGRISGGCSILQVSSSAHSQTHQHNTHMMACNIPGNDILQSVCDISILFAGKHKHQGLDAGVAPPSFGCQLCVDLYEPPFHALPYITYQRAKCKDTSS